MKTAKRDGIFIHAYILVPLVTFTKATINSTRWYEISLKHAKTGSVVQYMQLIFKMKCN